MVASPAIYSNTKPTVHDCAHLDTCEYFESSHHFCIGDIHRICRTCGEKDRIMNLDNYHFSVLKRPRDFVAQLTRDEYLAIERSFDKKKPEYRERVLRQLQEALRVGAIDGQDVLNVL